MAVTVEPGMNCKFLRADNELDTYSDCLQSSVDQPVHAADTKADSSFFFHSASLFLGFCCGGPHTATLAFPTILRILPHLR